MKKQFLFLTCLMAVFSLLSFTANAENAIYYTTTPPTIDGDIDQVWASSATPIYSINTLVLGTPTNNPAGQWRALYDDENYYFLVEISDSERNGNYTSGDEYNGDAIEIFIKKGQDGGSPVKCINGFSYRSNNAAYRYGDFTGGSSWIKDVTSNYAEEEGYILEAKIPRASMSHLSFTEGDELFIELCINQSDTGRRRLAQLATFNSSSQHWTSYANYTSLRLVNNSGQPQEPKPIIAALNDKTTICSNGTDFASLIVDVANAGDATATFKWKKDGGKYTAKGSSWNNIRPTAAGIYTCEATINGQVYTSNSIEIKAENICDDIKTSLPIFIINTNGQGFPSDNAKTKRDCDVKVIWGGEGSFNSPSDMADNADVHYDRKAIINYRGSTSRFFPKKPYAFACGKKDMENGAVKKGNFSMFDLPEEKDWILYPSYGDKSMVRNKLAMELYGEMGYYSSSMRYVDLYVDGDYKGMYIFMEKYERSANRINVTKDSDNALPEEIGYIIKLDKTESKDDDVCWYRTETNCGGPCGVGGCGERNGNPQRYELAYPGDDAVNFAEKKAYIQKFISDFEKALNSAETDEDFAAIYENYIDLQTFADYFIIAELCKVSDAYRISMFFSKDKGGKLKCTPIWDYDMGFGNSTTHGSFNTDTWQYSDPEMNEESYPIPFWWNKLMTNACFKNVVRTRWESLREGTLSDNNIMSYIDASAELVNTDIDEVSNTSPMGRNKNRWSWDDVSSDVWHIPSWPPYYSGVDFEGGSTTSFSRHEVPLMKAWIENRTAWLDEQISDDFGDMLTKEQFDDCCQIEETGTGSKTPETDAGLSFTVNQSTINIASSSSNNLIKSVRVYNVNGVLLGEYNNINSTGFNVNNLHNSKLIVLQVVTTQQAISKVFVIKQDK